MGSTGSGESGQIIVVTALLLAVLLVGLALVLNGAIYAENVATRGETSTADAMAVDTVTAERLGDAIDRENYRVEEATYSARRDRLAANTSTWADLVGSREALRGRSYSVTLAAVTNGTRVNQSDRTRNFEPANSTVLDANPLGLVDGKNWQTVVDAEVRAFQMTVERDSLKDASGGPKDTVQDLIDGVLDGTATFWVRTDGSGVTHRAYLLDDSDNDSVAVVVTEDDGSGETIVGACRASAPDPSDYVTVRITDATLEGADGTVDCPSLERVDEGQRDVYYAGSDDVRGTYRFLADEPEDTFRSEVTDAHDSLLAISLSEDDVYADSPTDQDPYTTTAIYDATVETTSRGDRLTFTRNVTYPPTAR